MSATPSQFADAAAEILTNGWNPSDRDVRRAIGYALVGICRALVGIEASMRAASRRDIAEQLADLAGRQGTSS